MSQTLYRRPLPSEAIAFSSLDGRRVFAEAVAAGGLLTSAQCLHP
jgi:hypothetical protein